MKERSDSQRSTLPSRLFPLIGAAILVGFALASLHWGENLFRRPRTIFDRSAARIVAPGYVLVTTAAPRIPPGAVVVVRTEPRNPTDETYYHRFADALLPGRRAIPASIYGQFVPPELYRAAEYILVVGPRPSEAPGELVLELPEGTLWRAPSAAPEGAEGKRAPPAASMNGLLWLASRALLGLAGLPLLSHRAFSVFPIPTRLVLAGAAGAVFVSFVMTAAVLVGVSWSVPWLIVAGAGVAALLRLLLPAVRGGGTAREPRSAARLPLAIAGTLSAAAVAAALVATASGGATSPDLIFFWGPKAQQFAIARTFDAGFMRDPLHHYMHAYYPPLVTNLGAFASMTAGRMSWTGATLTFPLLLGALALGLPGTLSGRLGSARAAAVSALTVSAIAYLGMEADIAGNGEMTLLLFETLAIALLLSDEAAEAPTQLLAGILLAGAAAAKVEGLPFVAAAAVLFFASRASARKEPGPAAARLILPPAAMLAAWFAFGATRRIFFGYSGYGRFLDLHPDHLGVVLSAVGRSLAGTGHALPWLVPLACLLLAWPLSRRWILPIGTAAVLTGFFLFTYIHRAEDPSLWISWSAPRIFSPIAMLFALAASVGRIPGEGSARA